MDKIKAKKILYLEEQLEIWEDKLNDFKKDYARAEGSKEKFAIKRHIQDEINPEISKINEQYIHLIKDVEVAETEAGPIVEELVKVVEGANIQLADAHQQQLDTILREIQIQKKSATAQLKVALPIIPMLLNYELTLDTANFLGGLWGKLRGLLKRKADFEFLSVHPAQDSVAQSKKQSSGKSSNFRAEIQKHIAKALSVSGMYFYTHVLWEELNKVLISLQLNEVECKPPLIAEQLVLALQQGGEECPVINKALLNSVVDCLDKESDEEKYEKALPHRKEILDGVGLVLGYLVLSLVDEDDARDVSAWLRDDLSNLYFELHASTPGGVELFIARKQERMADLDLDGHKATGKHLIYIETSPLSWHEKARLDEIQRIIWNSVFKEDRQHPLNGDDIKALKAKLLTLRTIGRGAENHYVAIRFEDDGDDSYRKICEDFLSELKIPMVRFGVKGDKQAFGGIEFDLMSSVEQFLKTINKYT